MTSFTALSRTLCIGECNRRRISFQPKMYTKMCACKVFLPCSSTATPYASSFPNIPVLRSLSPTILDRTISSRLSKFRAQIPGYLYRIAFRDSISTTKSSWEIPSREEIHCKVSFFPDKGRIRISRESSKETVKRTLGHPK